ncbi:MAG: restriction system-associated AAA family ATPase [Leptospirales bacterium]
MKLIRLKLNSNFRSLQSAFEIHFMRDWDIVDESTIIKSSFEPYVLAGPNGSGKSNILEALSAIFYHIECMSSRNLPDQFIYDEENNRFGYRSEHSYPDAFELEYLIYDENRKFLSKYNTGKPLTHINITKEAGQPPMMVSDDAEINDNEVFGLDLDARLRLLPTYIIGYSSGENEILSLPFFKRRFIEYDEYKLRLLNKLGYAAKTKERMIYLDASYSQAIVICNLLMQEKKILEPFSEELDIIGINRFRIIIRKISGDDVNGEFIERRNKDELEEAEKGDFVLLEYLTQNIESLMHCSTMNHENMTGDLYLDYCVNDATKEAFKFYFEDALDLFHALSTLLNLNLLTVSSNLKKDLYTSDSLYVSETVPMLASDERIMRFKDVDLNIKDIDNQVTLKSLSDGEHQFLHAIGLSILFNDKNSLFLLDEPETHFNPDWRSKLITRLGQCFIEGSTPEMLITTHSPFLISDSKPDNVFVFNKDRDTRKVAYCNPDFNTFGASVGLITEKVFNKDDTISELGKSKIDSIRKMPLNSLEDIQKAKEVSREIGESPEKIFLFRELIMKENELKRND